MSDDEKNRLEQNGRERRAPAPGAQSSPVASVAGMLPGCSDPQDKLQAPEPLIKPLAVCVLLTPPGLVTAALGSYFPLQHIHQSIIPSHTCTFKIPSFESALPSPQPSAWRPYSSFVPLTISLKSSLASPHCSSVFQRRPAPSPYHR